MNKKALALVKVATAILILALLLVLLIFLIKARIKAGNLVEDSECQSSIIAHTTLIKALGEDITPEITCPTKYYTITSSNEDSIKRYMAESLKSCWGTWGRGELELFKQDGTYCHICSVTDFKKKDLKITGFNNYLKTQRLEDGPFKGVTYLEYLGSAYRGDFSEVENSEIGKKVSDNVIYTDSSYAVIFTYAKGEAAVREFFRNVGSKATPLGGKPATIVGGAVVWGTVGAITAVVGGIALCFTGIGCAVTISGVAAVATGGAVAGGAVASDVADDVGWIAVTIMKPYNAEELKLIGCEISPASQDRQKEKLG